MARKSRITLSTIKCRGGCGKQVTTTNRSIHGLDALHEQYAGFCDQCLPISEQELIRLQSEGILSTMSNR